MQLHPSKGNVGFILPPLESDSATNISQTPELGFGETRSLALSKPLLFDYTANPYLKVSVVILPLM